MYPLTVRRWLRHGRNVGKSVRMEESDNAIVAPNGNGVRRVGETGGEIHLQVNKLINTALLEEDLQEMAVFGD